MSGMRTFLSKEPITQALNYLHNHWDALSRSLTDGSIPIDTISPNA